MKSTPSERSRWLKAIAILLAGVVLGWIARSHVTPSNHRPAGDEDLLEKKTLAAISNLDAPAKISVDEELGVVTLKGSKDDVQTTQRMIETTRAIFRQSN